MENMYIHYVSPMHSVYKMKHFLYHPHLSISIAFLFGYTDLR